MNVDVDFIICGAGIAGLWLLNLLKKEGYSALLFEGTAVGSGQTSKAQGIIHGGAKYALQGNVTKAALAISDMPGLWAACLANKGKIDLSDVDVLSPAQYLFSTHRLSSKLTGFFAGLTLQGKVQALIREDYPEVFQHKKFKGAVYSLMEMTVDVNQVLQSLLKNYSDCVYKIKLDKSHLRFNADQALESIKINDTTFRAQRYIFTAGSGNEFVANTCFPDEKITQRRPLHMVVMKHDFNLPVYAHCLGLSATPRLTITTHLAKDGKTIWYIGGGIAETGVALTAEEQIKQTKKELNTIFSWIDFSSAQFATFFVDRAESLQEGGKRPDTPNFKQSKNSLLCWPTKLAFAPALAEDIMLRLKEEKLVPQKRSETTTLNFPHAKICEPIWDELLP